jgi:hypothetical protein
MTCVLLLCLLGQALEARLLLHLLLLLPRLLDWLHPLLLCLALPLLPTLCRSHP